MFCVKHFRSIYRSKLNYQICFLWSMIFLSSIGFLKLTLCVFSSQSKTKFNRIKFNANNSWCYYKKILCTSTPQQTKWSLLNARGGTWAKLLQKPRIYCTHSTGSAKNIASTSTMVIWSSATTNITITHEKDKSKICGYEIFTYFFQQEGSSNRVKSCEYLACCTFRTECIFDKTKTELTIVCSFCNNT